MNQSHLSIEPSLCLCLPLPLLLPLHTLIYFRSEDFSNKVHNIRKTSDKDETVVLLLQQPAPVSEVNVCPARRAATAADCM